MWPDLAKFRHFGKNLEIFGNIFKVYLIFGKVLNPLWGIIYVFGQFFIDVNGQILKKTFQSGHTDPRLEWSFILVGSIWFFRE